MGPHQLCQSQAEKELHVSFRGNKAEEAISKEAIKS